jgi:S-methylmethionine-dependent homocysteine/selenocysteine methylase
MKKIAKEKFENNLDNLLLNNSSNPKMYWKIMKMLIKSNKEIIVYPHSGIQLMIKILTILLMTTRTNASY